MTQQTGKEFPNLVAALSKKRGSAEATIDAESTWWWYWWNRVPEHERERFADDILQQRWT